MSAPAIVFAAGIVGKKIWLIRLPCPIFTVLVLLVFTKLLGDRSLDLTSEAISEL